ncbi:MAG: hypothetical protein H0W27_03225 [Actinobacteria bacterium]|nr:hypothetical protein [Actinomycetota bacterium]
MWPLAQRGNRIEGDFIGTNATGARALGNGEHGVRIEGSENTVGGTEPAARNLISGNDLRGLILFGAATGNRIEGNYVGTNAEGTAALGNGFNGVIIEGATNNTIGGTAAGAGNVISGNAGIGVNIVGGATGNKVEGNRIGPNAAGTADLGNGGHGVNIFSSRLNTIAGTTGAAGNLISGNEENGVFIFADDNTVQGNAISGSPPSRAPSTATPASPSPSSASSPMGTTPTTGRARSSLRRPLPPPTPAGTRASRASRPPPHPGRR